MQVMAGVPVRELLSHRRTGARCARACTAAIAAAFGLLAVPAVAAAKWETPRAVDQTGTGYGASNANVALSVNPTGIATALFFQAAPDTPQGNVVGSPFAIRRRAGVSTVWSSPAEIPTPDGQIDGFPGPDLAATADGGSIGVFAVKPISGTTETVGAFWPASGSAPGAATPVLCTSGVGAECAARTPQVALDGSGNGYAVASSALGSNGDVLFARTVPPTGSWEPAQVVAQGYAPRIAVDPAGDVVIIYARDDLNAPSASLGPFSRLYERRELAGSTTWSAEQTISGPSETTDSTDPVGTALVIDRNGDATALFPQGTEPATGGPPNGSVIFAVNWPTGAAAPLAQQRISPSFQSAGGNADDAVLAVEPAGRLTAAWQVAGLNTTVSAAQYRPASGWSSSQQVSPTNSSESFSLPKVTVDALGTVTLTYVDSAPSGSATLDSRRKPAGRPWFAAVVISDSGTGAGSVQNGSVQIAAAKAGQADVIFVQQDNGINRLFATRFNDTTAPTIKIVTPEKGARYRRGSKLLADYSCQDEPGGSGIASCTGTVQDHRPLNTSTPGAKTFTVTATDGAGNTITKTVGYRVTPPPPPRAVTGPAESVKQRSAILTGTVSPHRAPTAYFFQYGTSNKYGSETGSHSAGAGSGANSVSVRVAGLEPGSIYHFRIVATSSDGTVHGSDRTFKTRAVVRRSEGTEASLPPAFTG